MSRKLCPEESSGRGWGAQGEPRVGEAFTAPVCSGSSPFSSLGGKEGEGRGELEGKESLGSKKLPDCLLLSASWLQLTGPWHPTARSALLPAVPGGLSHAPLLPCLPRSSSRWLLFLPCPGVMLSPRNLLPPL